MELNLVHNSLALQIHRRRRHISLNKQEVASSSNDWIIRRFRVMRPSKNGDRPFIPFSLQCDLGSRQTPKPIKARSYGSPLGNACDIRGGLRSGGQFVVEDEYGSEWGGGLGDTSASGYAIDDDEAGLVDGFMLVE